jgi:hypothetical protein
VVKMVYQVVLSFVGSITNQFVRRHIEVPLFSAEVLAVTFGIIRVRGLFGG